jgi:hypothetical protein
VATVRQAHGATGDSETLRNPFEYRIRLNLTALKDLGDLGLHLTDQFGEAPLRQAMINKDAVHSPNVSMSKSRPHVSALEDSGVNRLISHDREGTGMIKTGTR